MDDRAPLDGAAPLPVVALDAGQLETITSALRRDGYVILTDALPAPVVARLAARAERRGDEFTPAGVGRDQLHQTRPDVRGDRIHWLDPDDDGTRWYLAWAELLRLGLNRHLFLGLFDYEAHLAWYPIGAHYRTHLDTFATANAGRSTRTVSTVLYLNPTWTDGDGGELILYPSVRAGAGVRRFGGDDGAGDRPDPIEIVAPRSATLVLFLSDEFPHEVRPVTAARFSVAGWFRTNARSGLAVDPPVFDSPTPPDGLGDS